MIWLLIYISSHGFSLPSIHKPSHFGTLGGFKYKTPTISGESRHEISQVKAFNLVKNSSLYWARPRIQDRVQDGGRWHRTVLTSRELNILLFNLKSLRHDSWNNAIRPSFWSADFLFSSPSIQTYVSNTPWCLRRPASFSLIGQWFILLLVRCISLTSRADVFSPLTAKLALPYPNLYNLESKQALSYRSVIRIVGLSFARIIPVFLALILI